MTVSSSVGDRLVDVCADRVAATSIGGRAPAGTGTLVGMADAAHRGGDRAPRSGRAQRHWDALALALAVAGAVPLALLVDPVWTLLLLLAAAAIGLGGRQGWWPHLVLGVSVLGWGTAAARHVADAGRVTAADAVSWGIPGLAAVAAGGLALAARWTLTQSRDEVERAMAYVDETAVLDPLTGLNNRRGLTLLGEQIIESARRRSDAVYCAFVNVDGVARVNDQFGHSAGDDVLLTVAEALRRSSRATDVVARWGDDEFVIVGPGTGLAPLELERRVRAHCVEYATIHRAVWQARVSAGGCVLEPWDDGTLDSMLSLADREMRLRRALRRDTGTSTYRQPQLDQDQGRPRPPGA